MLKKFIELEKLVKLIQEQKMLQKEILNLSEAAQYLGIAKSYLYKLTSRNIIPYYRPNGKLIFFKKQELDNWLTKNRVKSIDEINTEATNFMFNNKTSSHGK